MGKLDDIRAMREAKYEREQKRSGGVRPKADGASAGSVGGKPSRPRGGQRAIPSPDISDTGGQDVGSQHPEGVRGKFDRAAYQRKYMKDTYRPREKAKRDAEMAELKRLRELVGKNDGNYHLGTPSTIGRFSPGQAGEGRAFHIPDQVDVYWTVDTFGEDGAPEPVSSGLALISRIL